jgi:hypothetical protein
MRGGADLCGRVAVVLESDTMNSMLEEQAIAPARGPWFADACGEVPMPEVIVYNIQRLRSIGYLTRFGHYLTQLGLRAEEISGIQNMSRGAIEYAVESAGERAGWRANPEAHLVANGCRLLLIRETPDRSTATLNLSIIHDSPDLRCHR